MDGEWRERGGERAGTLSGRTARQRGRMDGNEGAGE